MSTRKVGALSTKEMQCIVDNADRLTPEEIGERLGRKPETIIRFMKTKGMLFKNSFADDPDRIRIRRILENKYYFKLVKEQLITGSNELETFINGWIDLYIQFKEDISSSEEQDIREMLMLRIQSERIRIAEVKNIERISDIEAVLRTEYRKPFNDRDVTLISRLETELNICRSNVTAYINQIKIINSDVKDLAKSLKGTRDQRFSRVDSGDKTFASLIRRLQDDKKRLELSRETELIKIATDAKREQLEGYHTFADGQVDCVILNENSAKKFKEEDVVITDVRDE